MNTVIVECSFADINCVTIKSATMRRVVIMGNPSHIAECCIQIGCCELGQKAFGVFDQIEFRVDLSVIGMVVAKMIEGRGYKVVDLRKVGMVPMRSRMVQDSPGVWREANDGEQAQAILTCELHDAGTQSGRIDRCFFTNIAGPLARMTIEQGDKIMRDAKRLADGEAIVGFAGQKVSLDQPVELEPTDEPITIG